jgi:hypothetical protein
MKALKIAATVVLAALGLSAALAAETLALARCTVLDHRFYGESERDAYELMGRIAVRRMADAVLEYAPAVALRTTDREQAYALAERALPPGKVADMLAASGPDIAQYVLEGGDMPVLRGARAFAAGEEAVVRALLLDGLWDMLPQKPSFPAFMPFTPEWNLGYGAELSRALRTPRWYLGMADQAVWLALSALVMLTGLLYLLWVRERKPFFAVTGALLTLNGLLLGALAAAAAYACPGVAEAAAALYPVSEAAGFFGGEYAELVRCALLPFRQVFALSAVVSLSFGVTLFTMGIGPRAGALPAISKARSGRSGEKQRHAPKHLRRA